MTAAVAGGLRHAHRAALGVHLALAAAVAAALARLDAGGAIRVLLIAAALLPLALTLPGLARADRTTLHWLAVALVLYAGLGSVEVIATASVAAACWFFCALLELGLLVMLNRRPHPPAPGAPEES